MPPSPPTLHRRSPWRLLALLLGAGCAHDAVTEFLSGVPVGAARRVRFRRPRGWQPVTADANVLHEAVYRGADGRSVLARFMVDVEATPRFGAEGTLDTIALNHAARMLDYARIRVDGATTVREGPTDARRLVGTVVTGDVVHHVARFVVSRDRHWTLDCAALPADPSGVDDPCMWILDSFRHGTAARVPPSPAQDRALVDGEDWYVQLPRSWERVDAVPGRDRQSWAPPADAPDATTSRVSIRSAPLTLAPEEWLARATRRIEEREHAEVLQRSDGAPSTTMTRTVTYVVRDTQVAGRVALKAFRHADAMYEAVCSWRSGAPEDVIAQCTAAVDSLQPR